MLFKNKDLKNIVKKILKKYKQIKKILNNNSLTTFEKQLQIENYCLFEFKTSNVLNQNKLLNIDFNKYLIEEINNIDSKIKKEKIIEFKNNIANFEIFIYYIINNFIMKENSMEDILYTNLVEKLKNQIKEQYKLEKIEKNNKIFYNSIKIEISDNNLYTLINIILNILEKLNILEIKIKQDQIKTIKYIIFSEKFIRQSYKYHIQLQNLPMIYKPNDWIYQTKFPYFYNGGYLKNKNNNIISFIHFNKEQSQQTLLKNDLLKSTNYLQQQSFEINHEYLNFLKKNINKVLKEELNFDLNLYENFNDIINCNDISMSKNSYNNKLKQAEKFLELIYISHIYLKQKIYFTIYLDFRTRIYYHAYLLSPQGTKISKKLLNFNNIKNNDMISLDVTASGIQLLGLLLNNNEYLTLTNLLINEDKVDIYNYYLNKYNNENNLKFKFQNRKEFKNLLMCYGYNQTLYGMVETYYENNKKYSKKELYPIMKDLNQFFKKNFKDIEELKKIINKIIDNMSKDQPFIIAKCYDDNFVSTQFYVKQKSHRFNFIDYRGKKQKITLKINKQPLEMNKNKTKRSTLVNIIHCMDSFIVHYIILKCKENNIKIYTIHDCFVIEKQYINSINNYYKEAIMELKQKNLIKQIIDNNVKDNDLKEKLYKKYLNIQKNENLILNIQNNILKQEEL